LVTPTELSFSDSLSGMLMAGTYDLDWRAEIIGQTLGEAIYDFNLVLTPKGPPTKPMPEPSTILLSGIGLLGVAAEALRRRRRPV
jgi:MYXO-CTERM domain-containing protein